MQKNLAIEEQFLLSLCEKQATVFVFLINGIKLHGKLASFDETTIILKNAARIQMIFKRSISTILPVDVVLEE
jgi:host factor-I protein